MPKIFELAKELNMGALVLVEKLKGLGLNVRSHMSVLSKDDAQKVLATLKASRVESKTGKKQTTKKKTPKRRVTVKKVLKKKTDDTAVDSAKVVAGAANQGMASNEMPEDAVVTTANKVVAKKADGPKVVRKKASTIAEEKAEKAKKREAESKQKESPARSGLQVVFDPGSSASEQVQVKEQATRPSPDEPSQPRQALDISKTFGKNRTLPEGQSTKESSEDHSKKRMGVLSQMIAKGKGIKRDLTQLRADEEMKSYGLSIGKVNYIPVRRKKTYLGPSDKTLLTEAKEDKRYVNVRGAITGVELAKKLKVKFKDFIGQALESNLLIKPNDYMGVGLAGELAGLYDYRVRDISFKENDFIGDTSGPATAGPELCLRSPVITIMGHVDHGKTTLLDAIRKAKVVEGEAGGITQHIGAYQVEMGTQKLTFLDTPGHAAFAAMRQRGADITDIVILVVAADDGVMPQTRESIYFCQQAKVPVIVAVNKMDQEGANPQRIQQELVEFELVPEAWGGETQYVNISALKGEGLDELLETVKLLAEILEIKANPQGRAEGVVIESRVEIGRGPMTTVLVQKGTLHKGDDLVAGEVYGRARSISDYEGRQLKSAGPGEPVQILGLQEASVPGDIINVLKNEREAKKIAGNRIHERKQLANVKANPKLSLEDFFASASGGDENQEKSLKLIIRTDVQGSYEAIKNSLEGLSNEEVSVKVIGGGVGAITDSDVMMAASSTGHIIGFNMRPVTSARRLAEEKGVDIKTYSIIYELIDDVRAALEGLLDPEKVEIYIGRAMVKETFVVPKAGTIAGSSVIDGKIKRGCHIRLLRDGKIVFDGKMSSLRRFKDDVKEVGHGIECGIGLEDFNDVKKRRCF